MMEQKISSHLADKSHFLPLSVALSSPSLFGLKWFIYHLHSYDMPLNPESHTVHSLCHFVEKSRVGALFRACASEILVLFLHLSCLISMAFERQMGSAAISETKHSRSGSDRGVAWAG